MVWSFVFLMITTVLLFVTKRWYVWGAPLLLAIICALFFGILQVVGLVIIVGLCAIYFLLKQDFPPWLHGLLGLIAVVISGLLIFHLLPGFHNWLLTAGPPKYYYNFDKPFAGLFILAFLLPLIHGKHEWYAALIRPLPLIGIGIGILLVVTYSMGLIHFDPHMPSLAGPWLLGNLLFTAVPEEAFFRGFIQRELTEAIPKKWGSAAAIAITSIAFVIIHVSFTLNMSYLFVVFLASLLYGIVYHRTGKIESAIFCHYLVNVLHTFLFR